MKHNPMIVVFSDLDGTLLDMETYSADDAREALRLLARERIPLVFCSSKTRPEIQMIQQELDVDHPFICENGGALYIPEGYFEFDVRSPRQSSGYHVFDYGRPYAEVVDTLRRTADRLRITIVGFSDMSVEEVADACHLSLLGARLAKLRQYDEPFRVVDGESSARARLFKALRAARLGCTAGGRFDHAGAPVVRGRGVGVLAALYARGGRAILTVGLGGTLNDVALLSRVDVPVIVQNGDPKTVAQVMTEVPTARLTESPGPSGWADAIIGIVGEARSGRISAPSLAARPGTR